MSWYAPEDDEAGVPLRRTGGHWGEASRLAEALAETLPLDAPDAAYRALAEKLRAEAAEHPAGADVVRMAAYELEDLPVRMRILASRERRAGRVLQTCVVWVTRCRDLTGRTTHFTFAGGQKRAARAANSFIDPEHMPPFDGEEGWFLVEKVASKPWPFWRGVELRAAPEGPR